ncbi:hypothetical protein [Streptomyces filipinensis]|uniref:hypothetical protein n=1 Tax=Streptomyces filipinensis TaxID=66887 RepID=UPI001783F230|nr:hypothetical protein [Streptomyces filipinensis]
MPHCARTAVYAVTAVACLLSLVAGFVRTRRAPMEIPTPRRAWREHRSRQRGNAASAGCASRRNGSRPPDRFRPGNRAERRHGRHMSASPAG